MDLTATAVPLIFMFGVLSLSSTRGDVDADLQDSVHTSPGTTAKEGTPKMSLSQYYASLSQWYVYGHCDVKPNAAISDLSQVITGNVDFKQSLRGGPTEIRVNITGFSVQSGEAGRKHGFHVHEFGDLSKGCQSAGSHYNPFGVSHGSPKDSPEFRHFGDLGNIDVDSQGQVLASTRDYLASLLGPFSIFGRAVVIHEGEDDLGRGNNAASLDTGNAGSRLACCTVGISDGSRW